MIRKNSFYIILTILLIACGSTKKHATLEQLPDWVKTKPVYDGFYVGFGSAQKTNNVSEYQGIAKNNALADMASEISVTVSNQSALYRFENSLGYSEDFTSNLKMQTKEDLAGYEMVNTYESETHYYVLYKLSKEKYRSLKEQKKTTAVNKAGDFYKKAVENKQKAETFNALVNFLKGLQIVKPYLTESLSYDDNKDSADLGNDLVDGFTSTINSIVVESRNNEIITKKGELIGSEQLQFTFKTKENKSIQNLPVIFSLANKPLRNNQAATNINGEVHYQMRNVFEQEGSVYFEVKLDAGKLAQQGTNDPLIRKMIRNMNMPGSKILIRIKNPSFIIETKELNLNKELDDKIIELKIEQLLTTNGYPVVSEKQLADYTIIANTNTEKLSVQGKMFTALLSGELKVFNNEQQLVFTRQIKDIKGVQLNYKDAGLDAYNNLTTNLNRNFLPQLKGRLSN